MDDLVEVFGIMSLIIMAIAVFSGLFMRTRRNPLFKIHRLTGYVALALGIGHASLVIFS